MRLVYKNQVYNTEDKVLISELKERGFVEETEKQSISRIKKEANPIVKEEAEKAVTE